MRIEALQNNTELALPWETNQESLYLQDKLPAATELPGWKAVPEPSGTSFRALLGYRFVTFFYSSRDRSGKEKPIGVRDDTTFMNPICRDWISGFPLVKASGWKRLFRIYYPELSMTDALFGAALDKECADDHRIDTGAANHQGALKFHHARVHGTGDQFRTRQTGRYIITPRKTKQGVADKPIDYEVVNRQTACWLVIDYMPRKNDPVAGKRICRDLLIAAAKIGEGGLGAKTASGSFGQVKLFEIDLLPGPDLALEKEQSLFAGLTLLGGITFRIHV